MHPGLFQPGCMSVTCVCLTSGVVGVGLRQAIHDGEAVAKRLQRLRQLACATFRL